MVGFTEDVSSILNRGRIILPFFNWSFGFNWYKMFGLRETVGRGKSRSPG